MTRIGINGRFFPNNWRSATDEIAFAQRVGFRAIQFPGKPGGLAEDHLGSPLAELADQLSDSGITATMEQLIFIDKGGKTPDGLTPLDVMKANLEAIKSLHCTHVHWHLAPAHDFQKHEAKSLEPQLLEDFKRAAEITEGIGVCFALEHNEPKRHLIATPESCAWFLEQIPNLGLVWDFNHTAQHQVEGFKELGGRIVGVHVSDTRLPSLNDHRPLGEGNLAYADFCKFLRAVGFSGPAILEIGGQPHSGGYNQDTDSALINSAQKLGEVIGP